MPGELFGYDVNYGGEAEDYDFGQLIETNKIKVSIIEGNGGGTLNMTGTIGINTAIPQYTLDVNGDGHFTGNLTVDGVINNFDSVLGNFGIGTTNPILPLEVHSDNSLGQALFKPKSSNSQDSLIRIQGARNANLDACPASVQLENYDMDNVGDEVNILGTFCSRITDITNNLGDVFIGNFADGETEVETMVFTKDSDVYMMNGSLLLGTTGETITDFQTNNVDGTIQFLDTPWINTRGIQNLEERGSVGTAILFGTTKYDNAGDNIAFITNGNTNLLVDSSNNVSIPNDLEVGGEIKATISNGIGALGYIRLDENSTTDLSRANYTDFQLNLDNQSTNNHQCFILTIRGIFKPSDYSRIYLRFLDVLGEIDDEDCYRLNGSAKEKQLLLIKPMLTGGNNTFSGHFKIFTGIPSIPSSTSIIGDYQVSTYAGNDGDYKSVNVFASLNNNATINTRITGIGLNNSYHTDDIEVYATMYRML